MCLLRSAGPRGNFSSPSEKQPFPCVWCSDFIWRWTPSSGCLEQVAALLSPPAAAAAVARQSHRRSDRISSTAVHAVHTDEEWRPRCRRRTVSTLEYFLMDCHEAADVHGLLRVLLLLSNLFLQHDPQLCDREAQRLLSAYQKEMNFFSDLLWSPLKSVALSVTERINRGKTVWDSCCILVTVHTEYISPQLILIKSNTSSELIERCRIM